MFHAYYIHCFVHNKQRSIIKKQSSIVHTRIILTFTECCEDLQMDKIVLFEKLLNQFRMIFKVVENALFLGGSRNASAALDDF